MAKLKDGFYKQTAEDIGSDLYVLLAGGGSKALSDFAYKSDLTGSVTGGPYLPTAGGTMTGPITMNVGTGIQMKYDRATDGNPWMYANGADAYGIRYFEGDPDKMVFSASGNAKTPASADLCINGNGEGTVTIRGNNICHAGNIGSQHVNTANKISHSTYYYDGNMMTNTTTSETIFGDDAQANYLFPSFMQSHPVWNSWADVINFTGYCMWGGTQFATQYNAINPRVAIRKYNQSRSNWGDWTEFITSGNIGSQSVASATNAGNADKLDGIDSTGFLQNYSQDYGSSISAAVDISPTLTAGIARVHISKVEYSSVLTGYDFNNKAWQLRFTPSSNDGVYFRSQGTGTTWKKLAFTSDIPTVTNYYWADQRITSSAVYTASPTLSTLRVQGSGGGRGTIYLVSASDVPNDLWFGAGGQSDWSLSSRSSSEGRYFGLYNSSVGWAFQVEKSNNRFKVSEWIQFDNNTGLYWPNHPNTGIEMYIRPNTYSSYGGFAMHGKRGGYSGILLGTSNTNLCFMDDGNNSGLHVESLGKWVIYNLRSSNQIGIGTSSCTANYGITLGSSTHLKGNLLMNGESYCYTLTTNNSSNWVYLTKLLKGNDVSDKSYEAGIGWHNTGGDGNGALTLVPHAQNTSPWMGSVGLFITKTELKYNGASVWHSGNDGSGSGLDADLLDGTHKTDLLTALNSSSSINLSITVGGTTKNITNTYATNITLISCYNGTTNNDLWSTVKTENSTYIGTANIYEVYNDGGPTTYGEVLDIVSAHTNHWQAQLWFGAGKTGHLYYRNKDYNDATWGSWKIIIDTENYSSYVNATNFPGLNKTGTVTSVAIANGGGISISGSPITSSGTITISNAGVRSATINGNYLRVNTNGADNDLTIPYATRSSVVGDGTMNMIPQYSNEINFGGTSADGNIYFGYRAADSKPIPTSFVFGGPTGSATLTSSGFKKKGSSDSYVLLGGGSHKLESSLSVNYASNAGVATTAGYANQAGSADTAGTAYGLSKSFTVFGVSFNGAVDTTVDMSTLIGVMGTGASSITDSTHILTSHVNGFNSSGNTTTIYARTANYLWNYIKDKIDSTYTHGASGGYLPLTGGTMTGSLTFNQPSSNRRVGIIGTYDPDRAAAIWSMGDAYQISTNGLSFGGLYGAAYAYFGSGYTFGAKYSIGHSFVWCQAGTPSVALGNNIWTKGSLIADCDGYGTVKIYGTSGGSRMIEDLGTANGFYIKTNASWGMTIKVNTNEVVIGNNTKAMYTNQVLDLGTSTKSWGDLYAAGGKFYVTSDGAYHTSDIRKKTNITKARNLDISDLLVEFDWKESGKHSWGYIAQDLLEVLPEAVDYNEDIDVYSVNYNVAHSAAIASLTARIKELEEKLKKYGIW